MPGKVLDASGTGSMADVAAGIVWAVDHGAHVISMSLGGPGPTQTLADAVIYAIGKGAVVVAAAGNSGNSELNYPAAFEGVISVAGTTPTDELYSWSNFGPWVQVAAAGCNVAPYPNGKYVNFCGTSSATPIRRRRRQARPLGPAGGDASSSEGCPHPVRSCSSEVPCATGR